MASKVLLCPLHDDDDDDDAAAAAAATLELRNWTSAASTDL